MENTAVVYGRRAVAEVLRAGKTIDKLYVLRDAHGLQPIVQEARNAGAVLTFVDRTQLDHLAQATAHQGLVAVVSAATYAASFEDIVARAKERSEPLFLVICESVEDPGNLGAILRSAEAAGAHGVVIPRRRSVGLTPAVAKASAGALSHLPVLRVAGIPSFLQMLKKENVWIYGTSATADSCLFDVDFSGPCAIVLGSEGKGLSRLSTELCDFQVSIPMRGQIDSLNVSAAAAVLFYQVVRSRR